MKRWKKAVASLLATVMLAGMPLTALAENSTWPGLNAAETDHYGALDSVIVNGKTYSNIATGTYEVYTLLKLPKGVDLTFEPQFTTYMNRAQILPVTEGAVDHSYPVAYTAKATDGREHRIYVAAQTEGEAWTEEERQEWINLAPLMLSYRDQFKEEITKMNAQAEQVEIGGYHPVYSRMLSRVLMELWGLFGTHEEAAYGQTKDPYTEETLRAYLTEKNSLESMDRNRWKPELTREMLTAVGDYFLDLAENNRIDAPELAGFKLGNYEGIVDGTNHVTITIPEEIELNSLGTPEVTTAGDVKANVFGGSLEDGKLLYRLNPYEPTTGVVYDGVDTSKEAGMGYGVDLGKTWVISIVRGAPSLFVKSFAYTVNGKTYQGRISEDEKKIYLNLPEGTDWTELTPEISHTAKEYSISGKTLMLKTDSYTQEYELEITTGASTECEILSYRIEDTVGTVNNDRIELTVPYGTDLEKVEPKLELSEGAEVVRKPEKLAYDTELTYEIKAEAGNTSSYTVVIHEKAAATGRQILSFSYGSAVGSIDQHSGTIQLTVPAGTNIRKLRPTIRVSEFATVVPGNQEPVDFSEPVTYTVTSQTGVKNTYQVTVTKEEGITENTYESDMRSLVSKIVSRYRTKASDDWEWMNIGFYDNIERTSAADIPAGFDMYSKIQSLKVDSGVAMTEFGRYIMTLTALGINASNLEPYETDGQAFRLKDGTEVTNLTECLYNYSGSYTINGPVFGLIALDMGRYSIPENAVWTREKLLDTILAHPYGSDGFGIDMVGAIMYSIAPYQNDAEYGTRVRAKLEEGLEIILGTKTASKCAAMNRDYTFGAWGSVNSESAGWVIAGLCSMGIDCHTDPRFSDADGNSVLTKYLEFADVNKGYFAHTKATPDNAMATYQGCYITQWYLSFLEGLKTGGAGTPCYFYYGRFNFETPLSDQAEIEAFSLDGQEGTIDQENRTITVKVPKGMDLSSVTPEITLSKGATLQSPMLPVTLVDGVEQAFVVMAEDGKTMNVYKVTVTGDETVDGKGTQIVMDSLELEDASILKDVELLGYTEEETEDGVNIILKVGSATDITALLLKAKLSYGATVSPSVLDGKTKLDLSDWNTITVTSQSGIKKVYHIRAEKKPVAGIDSFFLNIDGKDYEGVIDNTENTIRITGVPVGANVKALTPEITLTEGTNVCNPLTGVAQNFSVPVSYTVSGDGMDSRTYTVHVTDAEGNYITGNGSGNNSTGTDTKKENRILKFSVCGTAGVIDEASGTIMVTLPEGTDVSAVIPEITISDGANIDPVSGEAVDLRNARVYTVTNGTESRQYVVTVVFQQNVSQELWNQMEENSTVSDHQIIKE